MRCTPETLPPDSAGKGRFRLAPLNADRAGLTSPLKSGPKTGERLLLRKEVIQPQVPLRLPCYDFIPVTGHTLGTCPPCGSAQ